MKRILFTLIAVLAIVAMVAPAYAVDSKFGGLFRVRFYSSDNVTDGDDNAEDNYNQVDQRFRLYYYAVASENLRFVYKAEVDSVWGLKGGASTSDGATVAKVGGGTGGQVGADAVNVETKNAYMEFKVPGGPITAKLGIQGVCLHDGWGMCDDYAGARFDFNFDPVNLMLYWFQVQDDDQTDTSDDIWNTGFGLGFKQEMFDAFVSLGWERRQQNPTVTTVKEDDLYTLMADVNFNLDMLSVMLRGGMNFGTKDYETADDVDYNGYMFQAQVSFNVDPVAVKLGGFYVSGDDNATDTDNDEFEFFNGASYYWAELLGYGTFDELGSTVGDDHPANLMALNAGLSLKPADATKISLDYWYVQHAEDVVADSSTGKKDDKVGSEVDLIIDQGIYEGLNARLVGAYLFADDAFSSTKDDDDAYELGLRLQYTW